MCCVEQSVDMEQRRNLIRGIKVITQVKTFDKVIYIQLITIFKINLVNVKAKRGALEQKLRFSHKIEEQEKILNKLRLQQQLSETLAEEVGYEGALKEQNPFDCDETEQLPKDLLKIFSHSSDVDCKFVVTSK